MQIRNPIMAKRATKAAGPKAEPKAKPTRKSVAKTKQEAPAAADAVVLSATSEAHSVTTRAPARNQLAEDVERFLAAGGEIEEVPRDLRADPPRKPENNYGRGSI